MPARTRWFRAGNGTLMCTVREAPWRFPAELKRKPTIASCDTIPVVRALITAHLPIGPVLQIADRELFEERVCIDELFTRCPAGRVSARHECSCVDIFRN